MSPVLVIKTSALYSYNIQLKATASSVFGPKSKPLFIDPQGKFYTIVEAFVDNSLCMTVDDLLL